MSEPQDENGHPAPLDNLGGPLEEFTDRMAVSAMVRIQRMRHATVRDFVATGIEAARKKRDAAKLKARTQLEARETTVEDRKARAVLESANAVFDADCAAVVHEGTEKTLYLLKDDWDTARSAGANARAERNATEGWGS